MKNLIFFILLFTICISCNKVIEAESPEKLFEKYKGSVVIVANQYYYDIQADGVQLYYSPGSNSDRKLFTSINEVISNLSFSTGTGFIISKNGEIITNEHVINPKDESYLSELSVLKEKVLIRFEYNISAYNDTIESIKSYYYDNSDYMDYETREKFKTRYALLNDMKDQNVRNLQRMQYYDIQSSTIKIVNYKVGIAFNDTHVTDFDDLQECVIIKHSTRDEVDLALLQTKTKKFNLEPSNIFNFDDNNPNLTENPSQTKARDIKNPVKINDDVFMIGFNRGFSLANTKQGIKSQFTSGRISQESDGDRILYTIPTLEGSSGSPIIDKWGNLVGVNFAKITNSQNFSFGVPVNEVKKFYNE